MKKYLIALLLSLSCAFTMAAVGCDSEESSSADSSVSTSVENSEAGGSSDSTPPSSSTPDEPEAKTCAVTFTEGEGYFFDYDIADASKVQVDSTLSFNVRRSVFYNGTPIVYFNGEELNAESIKDNVSSYSITVHDDAVITVDGVQKKRSQMQGTGTMEDAYVVSEPIDLLHIAEQVNRGNTSYINGAYVLANDIDCGGEELKVIGDYSSENAFFSGCFSCIADSESGAIQRYTISNFTINSNSANYVGLFGTVFANPMVTSSGLFYGICIDDYTINVSVDGLPTDQRSVVAGSLIGYGSGVNAYLCDATNGTINVYADSNYFAYAGGLVGYQQGFYDSSYGMFFPAEVAYAAVDVDINVLDGLCLYAGGVSGYTATNYPIAATAFVHNSYSTGSVTGALRAGGVVGGLGQHTSVSNCYATGDIIARATQNATDALTASDEYCIAFAGGLVGYAENDTIASDSFFNGSVTAYAASGDAYKFTGMAIGGGQDAGAVATTSQKYIEFNCLSGLSHDDLVNLDYYTDNLGWEAYDWNFESGKYPTICYVPVSTEEIAVFNISYVTKSGETVTVGGAASQETPPFFSTTSESNNSYVPIGNLFYNGGIEFYYHADNGYLSYGYYFDKECTLKVPYSFVATRSFQLYVGFADPQPVLGTYQVALDNAKTATLTLDATGRAMYTDGETVQETNFFFDGEILTIEAARLARYFNGEIVIDENATTTGALADPNFDLYRYAFYDFCGTVDNDTLYLYDGVYFTKDNPLISSKSYFGGEYYKKVGYNTFYYTFYGDRAIVEEVNLNGTTTITEYDKIVYIAGERLDLSQTNGEATHTVQISDLKEFDAFKGSWTKSATISKTYTFDGINTWEYVQTAYNRNGYGFEESVIDRRSGTYRILDDGRLFFASEGWYEHYVSFDENGNLILEIGGDEPKTYYREYSYTGTWSNGGNFTLQLLGIGANGIGNAVASYTGTAATSYDLVYEISETDGYIALYWPSDVYGKEQMFGYFTYDYATNTLSAVIYDSNNMESGYSQLSLFVLDDYNGEWICNDPEFENVDFSFDGNGLYGFLYGGTSGTLTIREGDQTQRVEYTLDSVLTGHFAYKGKLWTMTYDEDRNAIVLSADHETELERKDVFADLELVDMDGNRYVFDGKGNLSKGGNFTVNGKTSYKYKHYGNHYDVYDANDNVIGSIRRTQNAYTLDLRNTTTALYIANDFMGEWAMGTMFQTFKIGPTDLNGNIQAVFDGKNILMSYLSADLLSFRYTDIQGMPVTYYVFMLRDDYGNIDSSTLVFSQYTNLMGEYIICTKIDALYGTWISNKQGAYVESLTFDGADCNYSYGTAKLSLNGRYDTYFFYQIQEKGIIMWSQEMNGGKTWFYKIKVVDLATNPSAINDPDAYICGNKALYRIEVDALYLSEAVGEDGNTYFFDGEGNMLHNGQVKYTYEIKSSNASEVYVTDLATKMTYVATFTDVANPNGTYTRRMTFNYFYIKNVTLNDNVYSFNGEGVVEKGVYVGDIVSGDTVVYTYVIQSRDDVAKTATLLVTDLATNKTYSAILNYQNINNVTLTLGEEIQEENN